MTETTLVKSNVMDRFWRFVSPEPNTGCWLWAGTVARNGYGKMRVGASGLYRRMECAHRVAFELYHGAIPAGMEIDHKCFNRSCVNPMHLQAVTVKQNRAIRDSRRTTCPKGHPYTCRDERGHRRCGVCRKIRTAPGGSGL